MELLRGPQRLRSTNQRRVSVGQEVRGTRAGLGQEPRSGDRTGEGPVTGFARHGGGQPNGLHQNQ
jgi:hypothetical protein